MRRETLSTVTKAHRAIQRANTIIGGLIVPLSIATLATYLWSSTRISLALVLAAFGIGILGLVICTVEIVMVRKMRRDIDRYPYSARYRNRKGRHG